MLLARVVGLGVAYLPFEGVPGVVYRLAGAKALAGGDEQTAPFRPVEHIPPADDVAEDQPVLTTGRVVEHFNSGELTRRSATLMRPYGEERLGINPADAADRGIETGDPVRVSNVRGAVTVPANPTPAVQPGVVFLSFHFADPLVNAPTGDALDPDATIPEYRHSAVSAEAADGGDPGDDGENG